MTVGINPYAFQQYAQNPPLGTTPLSSLGGQAAGLQAIPQIAPLLQIVPQQLQHLQQLVSVQLQELQQLQQIVQLLPAQLHQLQQLIQYVPQQLQQLQQTSPFQHPWAFQQSPFQQSPYQQPFAQGAAFQTAGPWGPQTLGAQPSHVM
jgi:hypothetical protein